MSDPARAQYRHGTSLGCIGRCKVCGKAIQLRRLNDHGGTGIGSSFDVWVHMGKANHTAVLNPGVCDEVGPLDEYRGQ